MRLKDKVAIITGGSRGIGFATADKFLKEGASVVLAASSQESADVAVDKLKEKYPNAPRSTLFPYTTLFRSVFNTTRVAAECMVARGKGVILSTSSMVSISGQPSGFAYPASKFAVNGLTVSLARELGPKGIRVNAVAPGITETDMMKAVPKEVIEPMIERIPLRRLGQPEDIANAFVFLASDEASYITGVILSVDGMARS